MSRKIIVTSFRGRSDCNRRHYLAQPVDCVWCRILHIHIFCKVLNLVRMVYALHIPLGSPLPRGGLHQTDGPFVFVSVERTKPPRSSFPLYLSHFSVPVLCLLSSFASSVFYTPSPIRFSRLGSTHSLTLELVAWFFFVFPLLFLFSISRPVSLRYFQHFYLKETQSHAHQCLGVQVHSLAVSSHI